MSLWFGFLFCESWLWFLALLFSSKEYIINKLKAWQALA
jgi:hypothetical protein